MARKTASASSAESVADQADVSAALAHHARRQQIARELNRLALELHDLGDTRSAGLALKASHRAFFAKPGRNA